MARLSFFMASLFTTHFFLRLSDCEWMVYCRRNSSFYFLFVVTFFLFYSFIRYDITTCVYYSVALDYIEYFWYLLIIFKCWQCFRTFVVLSSCKIIFDYNYKEWSRVLASKWAAIWAARAAATSGVSITGIGIIMLATGPTGKSLETTRNPRASAT